MDIVLRLGERQRYSALRTKRRAIFHSKTISHSSHYGIIPRARLQFMPMAFGYAPQGSSGMSYCNQTPFPPREGWGLGTRLLVTCSLVGKVCVLIACPCWRHDSGSCRQGVCSCCVLVGDLIPGLVGEAGDPFVCPCRRPDSGSCRQGVCSHCVSLLAT